MLGETLSLVCAICWAIGIVLFKRNGESLSANSLNLFKNFVGIALIIPTALFFDGLNLPDLSGKNWLILIASGYLGIAIADSFYFKALRLLGAGRTAIVASLYSPFVIILSILLLNESLAIGQWLGFVLVLIGIALVVYQKHYQHLETSSLYKGTLFAASAVFLTALGVVMMKPILELEQNSFFWIVALRLLAGILGMLLYVAFKRQWNSVKVEFSSGQHNWVMLIVASVFATYLAMLFWLGGFKYTSASVASVLNETSNIFIVILAWLFLKEPLGIRKLAGVLLTFVGVVIFLGII